MLLDALHAIMLFGVLARLQVAADASEATAHTGDEGVPRALLAEEVLMYHRAVSRLTEMAAGAP